MAAPVVRHSRTILKPCRRYEVIFDLANDIPLSPDKKDHTLSGSLAGFRECHIQPDWLLIYNKEDNGDLHILNLIRTGTHSDLFKK